MGMLVRSEIAPANKRAQRKQNLKHQHVHAHDPSAQSVGNRFLNQRIGICILDHESQANADERHHGERQASAKTRTAKPCRGRTGCRGSAAPLVLIVTQRGDGQGAASAPTPTDALSKPRTGGSHVQHVLRKGGH